LQLIADLKTPHTVSLILRNPRSHGDGSSVPEAQRSLVGDIPVPKDQPGLQQVCPHSLIGKTMEPSPWRSGHGEISNITL